ncbi:MAG: GC-type dockerin domain-anchored protein [Planctomycetota bacterium]|nr:GC-type dockerin domain-anchored protein [Planctomycetota bacterium]
MHIRFLPAALLLATLAAVAGAQDYFWTITDSGDRDGIIEPGEEAIIDLQMVWGPPGVAFAYSSCDVIGIEGWADGEVLEADAWYCSEGYVLPPRVADNNDILEIENFQLPGLFNCGCCGRKTNPIPQLHLRWRPSSYFDRSVTILPVNFLGYWDNGDPIPDQIHLYTDQYGSTIALMQVVTELTFPVRCPADWNDDARLDAADFHAFLEIYLDPESGLEADFNEDDTLDTRDLTAYLNAWASGC